MAFSAREVERDLRLDQGLDCRVQRQRRTQRERDAEGEGYQAGREGIGDWASVTNEVGVRFEEGAVDTVHINGPRRPLGGHFDRNGQSVLHS